MIARIWRRLRGRQQSPRRVASAVGIGLFIGCLPLYGLHFMLCLLVCLPLGLDLVLAYLTANISNPLVAPFLVTLEVELGSLLSTGHYAAFTLARAKQTGILGFAWQAAVGSVLVGSALGAIGFTLSYFVARRAHAASAPSHLTDDALDEAVHRTLLRYAHAPLADRLNVAGKLRWDPLTRLLGASPLRLGRVLDAGAGRGQFGLLLVELGKCDELHGFDADPRKVSVADSAASSTARFETRDLLDLPAERVDTLLLFDVLHYLPLSEQDELLRRASLCAPCGRILIRELDAASSARSAVTRVGEWFARVMGLHRGRAGRHYRPAADIVTQLNALGFSCDVLGASRGTPFGNVLIVATRG